MAYLFYIVLFVVLLYIFIILFTISYLVLMKKQIIFFTLLCLALGQAASYKKVVVQDKDALCLDGTYGAYYISEGTSLTKFILYFQGGAWCGANDLSQTLESCYQRSKGDLGSSKNYPPTATIGEGILSNNPKNSFHDFTKVYIKYCDGSGHQGSKTSPVAYKDAKLYFRGSNLTIAKLNNLQKTHGLFSKSSQIMVTGASAGGLAAFTWVDYIYNKSSHKNVYGAPDSGIFLNSQNFHSKQNEYGNGFLNLFKLSNVQTHPPIPGCVQAYPNETYKCLLVEYMQAHIKTRLFAIQSLYDTWSISQILGIKCAGSRTLTSCSAQQKKYIQQYHQNTTKVMNAIVSHPLHGAWAPICLNHVYTASADYYSSAYNIPMNSNNTIDKTLFEWVHQRGTNHKHIDQGVWPENKPCSGVASVSHLKF